MQARLRGSARACLQAGEPWECRHTAAARHRARHQHQAAASTSLGMLQTHTQTETAAAAVLVSCQRSSRRAEAPAGQHIPKRRQRMQQHPCSPSQLAPRWFSSSSPGLTAGVQPLSAAPALPHRFWRVDSCSTLSQLGAHLRASRLPGNPFPWLFSSYAARDVSVPLGQKYRSALFQSERYLPLLLPQILSKIVFKVSNPLPHTLFEKQNIGDGKSCRRSRTRTKPRADTRAGHLPAPASSQ